MNKPLLRILAILWLGLGWGCATGKTQFKIIKSVPRPTSEATPAAADSARQPTEQTAAEPSANTSAARIETYIVRPHDCLWNISRKFYHDPLQYPAIAQSNQIPNPDLIFPGQVLKLAVSSQGQALGHLADTGAGTASPADNPPPGKQMEFPKRPNRAFRPGEKLLFSVEYFGISAGYATLEVAEHPDMNGRQVYHLFATARTHPAFEWFFKVRDQIDSFFDSEGLFSWQYEKHIREGGYSNDSVLIYDQTKQKVVKDQGRTVVDAPAWTQDVLSEFYFFRTLEIKVGDTLAVPVVADDGKTYELIVKVLRQERVSVPAGKFDCLVVQPFLKFEGLFQQKGTVQIWLTNDAAKVPVLIKSAIFIGTIDIVLRNAEVVAVE